MRCEIHYAVSDFAGLVARPLGCTAETLNGAPMPGFGARYHVLKPHAVH